MTVLYEPIDGREDVDIVAVHGLSGHPWRSFMKVLKVDDYNSTEVNWLQDILPKRLEELGVNTRIMSYGYNANIG